MHASGTYIGQTLVKHDCFQLPHDVTFKAAGLPHGPPIGSQPSDAVFNVIIVRHGLKNAPKPPLTRTRHILPYHQP